MGRLGSWMQPHIDRIGERVGQVRVMKSTFGDGEEEKRTVEQHFGQTYIFETSPLHPTGDYTLYIIVNLPGGPVTWRKSWAGKFSSALIVCGIDLNGFYVVLTFGQID